MADSISSSLAGKRIMITRAVAESDQLACELSKRGAIPLVFPLISFEPPEDFGPLDRAIAEVAQFDWLFLTSAQAVRALMERCRDLQQPFIPSDSRLRVACVGPVTAQAARSANLAVEYVAATHNGVALANELGTRLQGAGVLLPRSDRANPDLPRALKRHGARVTEVIAYRTMRPGGMQCEKLREITDHEADAVLFFSPSAVQSVVDVIGAGQLHIIQDKLTIAAVGPVTAKALREAGVTRALVASDTTANCVLEALEKHFAAAKGAPAGVKQG